ncbi:unnamed protein product [Paramecium octaurelia]|uniref:Uncharacterized protein n=1 Tax=Paramecium octaurelia TaxID=43137 RepID=A0A8S1UXC0_PAROT|nr:unnamed protein product [Paramecium octaurelia]
MSRTPNRFLLPELENKSFRDTKQIQDLRRKLEKQQDTIKELVNLVKESKTESYKPSFNQTIIQPKTEKDEVTLQLLEEVKTLRRQINNIEQGPKQTVQHPIIIPQYLPGPPQQQQQQQQVQPMMSPYMFMNPYFPMPPPFLYPYPQSSNNDEPYKKIIMELIQKNNKGNKDLNYKKRDSYSSEYTDDLYSRNSSRQHRHHSNVDRRRHPNDRYNQRRNRDKKYIKDRNLSKSRDQDGSDHHRTISRASMNDSQMSYNSNQNRRDRRRKNQRNFTDDEILKLRRKLIGLFWYIRIGLVLRKYLKRVWLQRRQGYYETEAQQLIDKFDNEFNYKEVLILFVVECNKNKYFTKNWSIFDNKEVELKSKLIFSITTALFKKIPFMTKNTMTDEHKQFIKKISSPGGYLLPGHPQFVTDRVELRPNVTIGQISAEVSKLIQMDYVYIQILVQRVLLIYEWYSQFYKIPNYKEAMKIFVTLLHQLFIDHFINLPTYENPDSIFNQQQIVYCDFNQQNYVNVATSVDSKHPKYQPTKNCCILGLGTQDEMRPLYEQPGYKEVQLQFKEYCEFFYQSLNF